MVSMYYIFVFVLKAEEIMSFKKVATVKCKKNYLSEFNVYKNPIWILLKIDSDSVNLGRSLRFISNKLPCADTSSWSSML